MGVKLQLVLGVVLVFSACRSTCTPTTSTTPQNVPLEIPDRHLNLIEKSPKTDTEQKNVNSNTQKNFTSVKLNKSEPYRDLRSSNEDGNKKSNGFSSNVVDKELLEQDKENTIKQDGNREDGSRSIDVNVQKYISPEFQSKNNVFTLPISSDTEKYIEHIFNYKTTTEKLKDFANLVLTTPRHDYFDSIFKEAVQSIDQKLEHLDTEDDEDENSSQELQIEKLNYKTTPNSNIMDYKEMKNIRNSTMIDKNSAHKDMVIEQVKRLNFETSFNDTQVYDDDDDDKDDKFLKGDSEKLDTTSPKNNFILTTRKSISLTKPPLTKNNSYILNNKIETETFKAINIVTTELPTTRKIKGDDENVTTSADVANESSTTEGIKTKEIQTIPIETDTTTVGKITTDSEKRLTTTEGVSQNNKQSVSVQENMTTDQHTDVDNNLTSIVRDSELNTETTEPENLITTVNASEDKSERPNMEATTLRINENNKEKTTIDENLTSTAGGNEYNIETTDAGSLTTTVKVSENNKETTTQEELETTVHAEVTTINEDTTIAFTTDSTPLKSVPETTTNFEQTTEFLTEEVATTIREELITARDEVTTTSKQEATTSANEDLKIVTESITNEQATVITTTDREEIEATSMGAEKTTEAEERTTEISFRTSKSMLFPKTDAGEGTTDNSKETTASPEMNETTVPTVTEIIRRSTTPDVTDRITDNIIVTPSSPKMVETTDLPTSTVEIVTTTPRATTTNLITTTLETTENYVMTTTSVPKDTVTEVPTTIPPTTPSILTTIRTAPIDKVATTENVNEIIHHTNIPTTPSATINFIHIKTIDENHTTLVPETLNPGYNYSTPVTAKPIEDRKILPEEPMLITSTEFGQEGTVTSSPDPLGGDPSDDKKGTIAAIVISSVAAVCLVILAGLLYIMRKRQKRFNYGERCRPVSLDNYSVDNVSVYNSVRRKGLLRLSKRSYGNPAFDDPVAVTHPLNFPALAKFASNTDDIKAEFEEIPQIAARTSELPEGCETRNRYANVIPLPETRVFLKSIDGYPNSDYINANFVTGPKDVKGYYIATQAPMQNTVDDFWRMIWEQQSKVILMITHFFENGVEKCVDYLPPSEVLDCHRLFGDFQITLKKREVKDKYIISSLQLKNMVSNSWREVTHFWYMGWPEKGVPTEPNSLIAFLIEARSFMKSSTLDKNAGANGDMNSMSHEVNPVVVHCSPGTGRTGVVIACDIAIREFEQARLVDIPKIVYRIRRDRASAVQTKEQYNFIYKVVSLYATKLTGGALDSF